MILSCPCVDTRFAENKNAPAETEAFLASYPIFSFSLKEKSIIFLRSGRVMISN